MRAGDWWSDREEAGGWTTPAATTMPVCSKDSYFNCSTMRFVGDKDDEGRPCLQMWRGVRVSFSLISIRQI